MPRIARIVVPGVPHHVTQRGNRKQQIFFSTEDYQMYLALISRWCEKAGVEIWAYCLMPNHVHLVAVPETEDSLRAGIAEANRRYTCLINEREGWVGHLWQGRFSSYPMDEKHLYYAARYIELNPVRAGLVKKPADYEWSSARAHLSGKNDILVSVEPLLKKQPDWADYLNEALPENALNTIRKHERTGRPLGNDFFISGLESITNRRLLPKKPGPKTKSEKKN
jgi:putative transposase